MRRLSVCFFIVGCLVNFAGCGKARGDLSGTVKYKNKALVMGTVTALASDSLSYPGEIGEDGSYAIKGIPVGEITLIVVSSNPAGAARRPRADDDRKPLEVSKEILKKWFPIPNKYSLFEKSDLKLTINSGANSFDIDMTGSLKEK